MGVITPRAAARCGSRTTCQSSASTTSATRGTPDPPLTTVAQPDAADGEIAVRVLLDLLAGPGGRDGAGDAPAYARRARDTAPPGRW